MKQLTTLLLLLILLLSVLASCQGTVPTGSVATVEQTKTQGEAVLQTTEEKTEPKQTTEQKETVSQTKTEEVSPLRYNGYTLKENSIVVISAQDTQKLYWTAMQPEKDHTLSHAYEPCPIQTFFKELEEDLKNTEWTDILFDWERVLRYEDGGFFINDDLWYFADFGTTEKAALSITGGVKSYAFRNTTALKELTMKLYEPAYFAPNAFDDCPALRTVRIERNVYPDHVSIPLVFDQTPALFGTHTLFLDYASGGPYEPFTQFDEYAYQDMQRAHEKELTSCPVDDVADHYLVVDGVLVAYYGIGGHVVIPEGVTEIRGGVFDHCKGNILKVTLPSTLKKICTGAFANMPLLIDLALPDGLEEIETLAIYEDIDSIPFIHITNIPKNCKVAEYAFHDYNP